MNAIPRPTFDAWLPRIAMVSALVMGMVMASPIAHAQRGDTTRDGADECRTLVDAARSAGTIKDLDATIRQRNPSQATMNKCSEQIVKDRTVAHMIQQDKQRLEATARQQEQQYLATRRQTSPAQFPANQRVLRARLDGTTRLNYLRGQAPTTKSTKSAPTQGLTPPPPAVSQVTPAPAVPGTDMVIEGNDFGDNGGSVRLKLQGKTFNATINHWSDSWIGIYLPDNIGGVTESSAAVIEVQLANGQSLASTVGFVPLIVADQLWDKKNGGPELMFTWGEFPSTYFFLTESLKNDWKIADYRTHSYWGSSCTIAGPPAMTKGGTALVTRLLIGHGLGNAGLCAIIVDVQGPQGLSHGLEAFRPD